MNFLTDPSSPATSERYRAVWRWHFYAGILVAPFAIFLATTGTIYLWKPQYEAARYRHLLTAPEASITGAQHPASFDAQLAAAVNAAPPHHQLQSFQPAFRPSETAQVIFQPGVAHAGHAAHGAASLTVFVAPSTARVLGQLHDDDREMNLVKKLHSSLLAGKPGEYLVELAASWALVLFLTGLYLAWPRPRFAVFGFLLPRFRASGRIFIRDLHAVPAVWCALLAVFLLSSGLLWTNTAGSWYRKISDALGQGTPRESTASAHRSELVGWSPPLRTGLSEQIENLRSTHPSAEHVHHSHAHSTPPVSTASAPSLSLDRVFSIAREHRLPEPFVIGLPAGPEGVYSVISDREQPFDRVFLHLDQYSGRVLAEVRFEDFGYLAQFFSWGIVAHEGRLFGLANQILGTIAAASIVLLAVSGLVLWWQRRPSTSIAVPAPRGQLPRPILLGTLALAALLPLLAASLVAVFAFDRLILQVSKLTR